VLLDALPAKPFEDPQYASGFDHLLNALSVRVPRHPPRESRRFLGQALARREQTATD
jgi:hypothetical protein